MSERIARALLTAYRWGGAALYPLIGGYVAWRATRGKEDRARRRERYGFSDRLRPPGPLIWFHAASVGETNAVAPLIESVRRSGISALWICDPMHGNTEATASGYKTRRFDNILSELEQAFDIHRRERSILGGVHFELTGDDVTECIGGARGLSEAGLERAYKTQVDPRLNYEQALEIAMAIVRHAEV